MNDLIDTTEMYLRTIFELEEEGIVPLRARIAERLHQSGPTVSQTGARAGTPARGRSGRYRVTSAAPVPETTRPADQDDLTRTT